MGDNSSKDGARTTERHRRTDARPASGTTRRHPAVVPLTSPGARSPVVGVRGASSGPYARPARRSGLAPSAHARAAVHRSPRRFDRAPAFPASSSPRRPCNPLHQLVLVHLDSPGDRRRPSCRCRGRPGRRSARAPCKWRATRGSRSVDRDCAAVVSDWIRSPDRRATRAGRPPGTTYPGLICLPAPGVA
jgi:hypothetical protein